MLSDITFCFENAPAQLKSICFKCVFFTLQITWNMIDLYNVKKIVPRVFSYKIFEEKNHNFFLVPIKIYLKLETFSLHFGVRVVILLSSSDTQWLLKESLEPSPFD